MILTVCLYLINKFKMFLNKTNRTLTSPAHTDMHTLALPPIPYSFLSSLLNPVDICKIKVRLKKYI